MRRGAGRTGENRHLRGCPFPPSLATAPGVSKTLVAVLDLQSLSFRAFRHEHGLHNTSDGLEGHACPTDLLSSPAELRPPPRQNAHLTVVPSPWQCFHGSYQSVQHDEACKDDPPAAVSQMPGPEGLTCVYTRALCRFELRQALKNTLPATAGRRVQWQFQSKRVGTARHDRQSLACKDGIESQNS